MSEIESQEYFITLVAKGKKSGHLSLDQVYASLPEAARDEENFVEEILTLLESHHGILVSEEDMEKDLLHNSEEEKQAKPQKELNVDIDLEVDVEEPLIDHDLEEEESEIEEELDDDSLIDGDPLGLSGIAPTHRGIEDLDDDKIIDDHDEEIDDDTDDDDLDDEDDEGEMEKGFGKGDLSSFDDVSGYENRGSIIDIEDDSDSDSPRESSSRRSGILGSEKGDSSVDDPIRLYLREIGRENLLNAEQEVELSKRMEEGAEIIKNVILKSGILISSFNDIMDVVNTKFDEEELEFSPKELKEKMNDQKRYVQFYRETIKDIASPLKNYIELKKKTVAVGGEILQDETFGKKRVTLLKKLSKIELQPEEITGFTERYLAAERDIFELQRKKSSIESQLGVASVRELRLMGRNLAVPSQRVDLEKRLNMSADKIKELIRDVQLTEKQMRNIELEFEETCSDIIATAKEIMRGREMM